MATAPGTTTTSLSRQLLTINKLPCFGEEFNVKDKDGYTPLMNYVKKGAVDSVRILKESGADITATCTKDGHTALMMAVNSMFDDDLDARMVDALLEGDVDSSYVNYADPLNGVSALMIALDAGKYAVSLKLMAAGADVNQLNASGYSALTYAVLVEDLSTIDFLLEQNSMLAINQMWDAVGLAFEGENFSLYSRLMDEIENFPQKFIDIGVASVIPEAVSRDIGARSFVSPSQDNNMALLVANNPGPDLANSISSASMASRQSIQDGAGGVAPSATNVRQQRSMETYGVDIGDVISMDLKTFIALALDLETFIALALANADADADVNVITNIARLAFYRLLNQKNPRTGQYMKPRTVKVKTARPASSQDGAAGVGPSAAMAMPVANNPDPNAANRISSASMASGQLIQDGAAGVGLSAAMAMHVANNPGPIPPNSAPSASMAPRLSIQDGVGGVAPSARNVRKQPPNAAADDNVSQASRPRNNDNAPTEKRQKRRKR